MSRYLFPLIFFIVFGLIYSDDQCGLNGFPYQYTPFPSQVYLSYDESIRFALENYFTGVNLSFSFTTPQMTQPQPIPKIIQYSEGSLQESLPQITESQIIDILWDDSNITQLSQSWTSDSLVLMLMGSINSYTLTAGSFDAILAPNQNNLTFYENIPIQPPATSTSPNSQLNCSRIARVGVLEYYIDCTFSPDGVLNDHYFYYISFISPPYTFQPIPNNLTLPFSPLVYTRVIASTTTSNGQTYLIRYYNGLKQVATLPGSGIEVFNVTNSSSPEMVYYYDSGSGYSFLSNISSVMISENYMYAISTQGSINIFSNWFQGPQQYQQFNYDQMVFRGADLRTITFQNTSKESLVVIGSLDSVNLTALLFVSQTFQNFYSLPLPPLQQIALRFETYSVALGEDFFGVSYAVGDVFSDSLCYYYAVMQISSPQPGDCHTLYSHTSNTSVTFSRMNPAPSTDIMVVIRADQTYSNFSVFGSTLGLFEMTDTTNFTLIVNSSDNIIYVPFETIVLQPNDTNVYIDNDESSVIETSSFQIDSNIILFLNESIYGPQLQFELQSQYIQNYTFYSIQQLASNISATEGTFFSCSRKNINSNNPFLLIEKASNGSYQTNFRFGTVNTSSPFDISAISLQQGIIGNFSISDYFYANGYDILFLEDEAQSLIFARLEANIAEIQFPWNLSLAQLNQEYVYDVEIVGSSSGYFTILSISDTSLYITIPNQSNPLDFEASISSLNYPFPDSPGFSPVEVKAHAAFPNLAFVTTQQGNITYIVDYANLLMQAMDSDSESDSSENPYDDLTFVIIFANHDASSNLDVMVQPFENNLFYIFPSQNAIEHWDLSIVKVPFFCRNLELYTYNISFLTNPFVSKGSAFSSTTDTLYLLAQDTSSNEVVVLILQPNPANGYLINTIQLPFNLNDPQSISIDVTETRNSVYGNLLGDILVVAIGSEYYFWEVYPVPYITFPLIPDDAISELSEPNLINIEIFASLAVYNKWNSTKQDTFLLMSIFQNEQPIQLINPQININSNSVSSVSFRVTDYCVGTVYNFELAPHSIKGANLTSFISFAAAEPFSVTGASSVLIMKNFTYYLLSNEVVLVSNKHDMNPPTVPLVGPSGCDLYVDITETYGVATCHNADNRGIIPLNFSNFFSGCSFISLPSFQDIFIDGTNSLMFLLMQAETQGNSNLTIYSLNQNLCEIQNPLFVMQGWTFSSVNPYFSEFDVLMVYSTQVVYMIFLLDINYGLRILSYASLTNLLAVVASYSFEEIYDFFGKFPTYVEYFDLRLLENTCNLNQGANCTANLLLVPVNFHPLLLQFGFENLGLEISNFSVTTFLMPGDYQIDDYQVSDDLLIVLAHNSTLANPSLDMIAYNISSSSPYTSGFDYYQQSLYQPPMWVRPMMQNLNTYPEYPLSHPTFFLETDGPIDILTFPNIMNQTMVVYNISNNVTVNWEDGLLQEEDIYVVISNNFQQVMLPITLGLTSTVLPVGGSSNLKYIFYGIGVLAILLVGIIGLYYYKKARNRKIQYSRKKQNDPLIELLM